MLEVSSFDLVSLSNHPGVAKTGAERYVWHTSKRLVHFRERLHDRVKEELSHLDCVAIRYITLDYNACIRTSCIAGMHYHRLHYIALHCITLHYITLNYITVQYVTLHHITLHYSAVHYTTSHYITLQCSTLHYIT